MDPKDHVDKGPSTHDPQACVRLQGVQTDAAVAAAMSAGERAEMLRRTIEASDIDNIGAKINANIITQGSL